MLSTYTNMVVEIVISNSQVQYPLHTWYTKPPRVGCQSNVGTESTIQNTCPPNAGEQLSLSGISPILQSYSRGRQLGVHLNSSNTAMLLLTLNFMREHTAVVINSLCSSVALFTKVLQETSRECSLLTYLVRSCNKHSLHLALYNHEVAS